MPKIPYTGVPDTAPANIPQESGATPAAFGVGIGQAISHLGETSNQVGNELFSRANAMQQLQNENDANTKATDVLVQNGKLDNNFKLQQGNVPQQNLDSHIQQLRDNVTQGADGLSPDAKKMYNQLTLRRLGYDIVGASGYAAGQLKAYSAATSMATGDAIIDGMARNANNKEYLDQGFNDLRDSEMRTASLEDISSSDPRMALRIQARFAKATDAIANNLARSDPKGAMDLLDAHRKDIGELAYGETRTKVVNTGVHVYSGIDARAITGGDGTLIDRAKAITAQQESGPKGYTNITTTANRQGQPQSALGRYGIMDFNLPQWSQEALGRKVSKEEFMASPEIQDKIYEAKMGQYIQQYGVEGAGRAWLGGPGGVTNTGATDAFGTSVLNYGRAFASKMAAGGPASTSAPDVSHYYAVAGQLAEARAKANGWSTAEQETYLETLTSRISQNASVQMKDFRSQVQAQRNTLDDTLFKVGQNGRPPTSVEEATAINPNFQQTWNDAALVNPGLTKHIQDTFRYNARLDVPLTKERYDRWDQLRGEALTEPDKFSQESLENADLPRAQYSQLHEMQLKAQKQQLDTTKLNGALRTLGNAGLVPQSSQTDEAKKGLHQQFVGALQQKLDDFVQEKKRYPNENELMTIGSTLNNEISGSWFPNKNETFWDRPAYNVPSRRANSIIEEFKQRYSRTPSQTEISMIYQKQLRNAPAQQ